MRGKLGKPLPGANILAVAKEYGQAPEDVEQWEPYWLNRAMLMMEAEGIRQRRQMQEIEKRRRRA